MRKPNPRGGVNDVMKYNLCDVAALAIRLQPTHGADERALPNGPPITFIEAKAEFELDTCQLKRLVPRDVQPSPDSKSRSALTIYNRVDVEDLKDSIEAAAVNPAGVPIEDDDDDQDEQDNVNDFFTGMTKVEAATECE
ncbi:hypothetical protein EIP86_007389 [Pleurotus ostreatoroseus]|nr:hypothetical protein EIP86_007389 [Pleurotus ostreatoroseus]